MAFTPGDGKLRGPLYEGLPTLEEHRNMSPFSSFLDLVENNFVDKVLVGDVKVKDESLEQFASYQEGVFLLLAVQETNDHTLLKTMETEKTNSLDADKDCIRSMDSR